MGAREKLNAVSVWGSVIASALLGAAMGSWLAFWGALAVMLAACSSAGGIRTQPASRPHASRRSGGGHRHARGR